MTNIFRATQDPFIDDPREDFDAVVTVVRDHDDDVVPDSCGYGPVLHKGAGDW